MTHMFRSCGNISPGFESQSGQPYSDRWNIVLCDYTFPEIPAEVLTTSIVSSHFSDMQMLVNIFNKNLIFVDCFYMCLYLL